MKRTFGSGWDWLKAAPAAVFRRLAAAATPRPSTITVRSKHRARLGVEQLEEIIAPAGVLSVAVGDLDADGYADLALGAASGSPPLVRVVSGRDGVDLQTFSAYEPSFTGGVGVAVGDTTGDGVDDVVTGTGSGGGPRVRVFDGRTGELVREFFPYEDTFRGGVLVAAADVDGDKIADIITGTGEGGGPRVRVYSGADGRQIADFFAYEDSFRGGVLVAAADTDGDCVAEIITGTGVGGGPRVQVFRGLDGIQMANFFAYEDTFRGGVRVAGGDVDGDGKAEIVTGTGPGGGARVQAFDPFGRPVGGIDFFAYPESARGGVLVAAGDIDGDGKADFVTAPGPGGGSLVRIFRSTAVTVEFSGFDPIGHPPAFSVYTPIVACDCGCRPLPDPVVPPAGNPSENPPPGNPPTDPTTGNPPPGPGDDPNPPVPVNTPPRISDLSDVEGVADEVIGPLPFTIGDDETLAARLTVGVTSSDPDLIPPAGLTLAGGGAERTLTITPASGRTGTTVVTVVVRDPEGLSATDSFTVSVRTLNTISAFEPGLAGWAVAERGGAAGMRGTVAAVSGSAIVSEGGSFLTTLSKSFVVPPGAGYLAFAYPAPAFDRSAAGLAVNDAFEVALLDETGHPLVPVIGSNRDAFFNLGESGAVTAADGAEALPTGVRVDLSGVPAGTAATLVFRLVNNDGDGAGAVGLDWVSLPTTVGAPAPVKFFVADGGSGSVLRYGEEGLDSGMFGLTTGATDPSGAASNPRGDTVWVVDARTRRVTVTGAAGLGIGGWVASDVIDPQGVTVIGADLWLVDRGAGRVMKYVGGATRTSGSAAATDSFALDPANTAPSDLVTDGETVWVTDDDLAEVFVYGVDGTLLGRWHLDAENQSPSGITRNPTGGTDLWVVDRVAKKVFQYASASQIRDGSAVAAGTFLLGPDVDTPEGIADPPVLTAGFAGPSTVSQGTVVLVEGTVTPPAGDSNVPAVLINGRAAETVDGSSRYFSRVEVGPGVNSIDVRAIDSGGAAAAQSLTVTGAEPGSDPNVVDLSASFAVEYGATSFRADSKYLTADVAVRNLGPVAEVKPLYLVVRNVSDPSVRILGADGILADGSPYYRIAGTRLLGPGEVSEVVRPVFQVPGRLAFTFDVAVYGTPNRAPRFESVPRADASPGRGYVYVVSASDPDGDPVRYGLAAGPAGMSVDPVTGRISWTPTGTELGAFDVAVTASDGRGGTSVQRFTVTSSEPPPNRPPVFTSTPVVEAVPGQTFLYVAVAADADGDPVTYRLSGVPPTGVTIDKQTGEIRWVPTEAQVGNRQVSVVAEDGRGGSATQTFVVCVSAGPNRPPLIVSEPVTVIEAPPAGGLVDYSYDVEALAPDGGPLTYSLVSAPPRMTIDPQTGVVRWSGADGATAQNLVQNGDFSQGDVLFETDLSPAADVSAPGTYQVATGINHPTAGTFADHTTRTGNMLVVNSPDEAVVWRQAVSVLPDTVYEFGIWAAIWNTNRFERSSVTINGVRLGSSFRAGFDNGEWTRFTADWSSGTTTTAHIEIRVGADTGKNGSLVFDDIDFRPAAITGGTYSVTVRVDDGRGGSDEQQFAVRVKDRPAAPGFDPVVRWELTQFDSNPDESAVVASPAVADWDLDGMPDVIVPSFAFSAGIGGKGGFLIDGDLHLRVVRGFDGEELIPGTVSFLDPTVSPAVADLDGDGRPDAVVARLRLGTIRSIGNNYVAAIGNDGSLLWENRSVTAGVGGAASIADLDADGVPEVIIGRTVLDGRTGAVLWVGTAGSGINVSDISTGSDYGPLSIVADIDRDGSPEVLAGNTAYHSDGSVFWQVAAPDGFTAVGNFDADPFPEVVLVASGKIYLFEHDGTPVWGPVAIPGGGRGSAQRWPMSTGTVGRRYSSPAGPDSSPFPRPGRSCGNSRSSPGGRKRVRPLPSISTPTAAGR